MPELDLKTRRAVITIDGPAGAGKTTVAKRLAERLGILYLDTGALFRGLAWYAVHKRKVTPGTLDWDAAAQIAMAPQGGGLEFHEKDLAVDVTYEGRSIMSEIRSEEISDMASHIGVYSPVRLRMKAIQHTLAADASVVVEGRDSGTDVFPGADVKFFLTADPATRARRRMDQTPGQYADLDAAVADVMKRDARDAGREIAPLRKPEDAVEVDSTGLTLDETELLIYLMTKARLLASPERTAGHGK